MPADRTELDDSVYRLVLEALGPYDGAAEVEQVWSEGGGMWFTEVKPRNRDAAHINVAAEDETTLNVTVGNIWFEMFGPVERNLPQLREIIEGVFAGRLEESGTRERAYGRVLGQSRTFRIGHVHLPFPWSLRRPRRYVPYDA